MATTKSNRIVCRIDPKTHSKLKRAASEADLPLSAYVRAVLMQALQDGTTLKVVRRGDSVDAREIRR